MYVCMYVCNYFMNSFLILPSRAKDSDDVLRGVEVNQHDQALVRLLIHEEIQVPPGYQAPSAVIFLTNLVF